MKSSLAGLDLLISGVETRCGCMAEHEVVETVRGQESTVGSEKAAVRGPPSGILTESHNEVQTEADWFDVYEVGVRLEYEVARLMYTKDIHFPL